MDEGISHWVRRRAELSGARVAVVTVARRWTYAELDARIDACAWALIDQLGVRRGDRVALVLYNSSEFLEVLFACARLGAVCVPVNFRLAPAEVGYVLADAGADVVVFHRGLAGLVDESLGAAGVRVRHRVVVAGPQELPGAPGAVAGPGRGARPGAGTGSDAVVAEHDYEALLVAASGRPREFDVPAESLAALMYTSGTTGRPKGAMLTHANLAANVHNALALGRGLHEGDVTVTAAPMFHIGGLGVHTLPLLYVGGTVVVLAGFDPVATLAAMARERATVEFLVPAMWAALSRVPDFASYDLSALELAIAGGAPCPLPVIEFFTSRGVRFQEGFGMTETSPGVSVLDAEHVTAKAGSIGRPMFGVRWRLVDAADADVPIGQVGELVVTGPNVFTGYWMLPEATAEAFRGGWFHTGDLGRLDEDGYLTLVDRKKDMIITGGENVYPIEVEQVLARHPAVREVAVIGVPDPTWGEAVVAVVALEGSSGVTAAELTEFARSHLAHFKCPRRVEFVADLPRNATGKVLKTDLRARFGGGASSVAR